LIVHNVGITAGRPFLALEPDAFDRTFAANLRTPWFLTRRLVEPLIETERRGSILFISSLHSRFVRMAPDYSASKAAVVMLMRELSHELGPVGVRVNAISPGAIDTWSEVAPESPEHRGRTEALIPLGRLGVAQDIAPIALALLDDEVSGYVTGADVVLDGGLSAHNWLHSLFPTTRGSQH
jgi:3-oxoacyl-[acyl-carrier protein] reductase